MAHKTGKDLIDEAKSRIKEVTVADVQGMLESVQSAEQGKGSSSQIVYLDVREPNEWNLGHLPKATHLPRGQIEGKIEELISRNQQVVVYCATGNRSALAADTMRQMGYNATSMAGGFKAWAQAGGEIDDSPSQAPPSTCAIS